MYTSIEITKIDSSSTEYTALYKKTSFDSKTKEIISESVLLKDGQSIDDVELKEDFRINNCIDTTKMIQSFPGADGHPAT